MKVIIYIKNTYINIQNTGNYEAFLSFQIISQQQTSRFQILYLSGCLYPILFNCLTNPITLIKLSGIRPRPALVKTELSLFRSGFNLSQNECSFLLQFLFHFPPRASHYFGCNFIPCSIPRKTASSGKVPKNDPKENF